ncbi:hypothetical protein B0H67DRAFT_642685 [Lasiosphaeris hirsuta]|uniref:Uncharacterized protein n=1 Tax=Lasiosphaeris hirsuta TaxID=260670 RepID=A0AA40ANZ0_9PEZI|nr:hypothetical protein B0H67DRAFT_642685 [Lasiosphaeris hirsuta]
MGGNVFFIKTKNTKGKMVEISLFRADIGPNRDLYFIKQVPVNQFKKTEIYILPAETPGQTQKYTAERGYLPDRVLPNPNSVSNTPVIPTQVRGVALSVREFNNDAEIGLKLSTIAPQSSAISTVPSELVAVQAILEAQKAAKPQCFQQILASIYYLLAFNTEAQDYHFIVDPVDRGILSGRHIGQLEQLINRVTSSTVQVYYTPETGEMTIITVSKPLYMFLFRQLSNLVEENIAGVPGLEVSSADELVAEMPQYICCIEYDDKPYALFLLANPGNANMAAKPIGSVLSDITRKHPSVKMVVRLELGGLDSKIYKDEDKNNIEARVHRVGEKSRIQVWVLQSTTFIHDKASSSDNLCEGGELRLCLLSENAKDKTNIKDKVVSVLKFSDILNMVRKHCKKGVRLTGHPGNKALQASAFPLDAFKFGFTARTTQLLLGLRAVEQKARGGGGGGGDGGVESKAQFSSLSRGPLATRRGITTGTTGLGQIKADGSSRRIHGTTRSSSLMSLLSARHLLGRLLRR